MVRCAQIHYIVIQIGAGLFWCGAFTELAGGVFLESIGGDAG